MYQFKSLVDGIALHVSIKFHGSQHRKLTVLCMCAGLAEESASAGKAVTSLLQRMSKTGNPIAQDCFKLLATLMRASDTYKPTNAQLRFLLTWAFGDMEEAAGHQAAFALLKVTPCLLICTAYSQM